MRGKQQVLRRHRGALHGHEIFGSAARLVRIVVHVGERQRDEDDDRRAGNALERALDVDCDGVLGIAVAPAVGGQPRAHRSRKPFLAARRRQDHDSARAGGCAPTAPWPR